MGTSPTLKAELEPNDAPATAMLVTLTDTISGSIGREGDVDFFAIDLSAGTQLDANVDITGSALYNPTFSLLASDGVTPLLVHEWQSQEYRLRYTIQTTGRYYLRVGNYRPGTGTYVLRIGRYVIPQFGPGDPVTGVWSGSGLAVSSIAAGPTGDVFVGNGGGVFRLASGRDSVPLATGVDADFGLAVDTHGNVLTLGCEYPNGAIWRISPSGDQLLYIGTRATRSDIWVAQLGRGTHTRISLENEGGAFGIWSPDGRRVAYQNGVGGDSIVVRTSDGLGQEQVITRMQGDVLARSWSADGKYVVIEHHATDSPVFIDRKYLVDVAIFQSFPMQPEASAHAFRLSVT